MTVKELIEKLKEYDDNLEVFVCQRKPANYSSVKDVFETSSFPFIPWKWERYDYIVIADDIEENCL